MSAFEKLSILIPSYNSAATIRACLDSVLAQETPLPYEVIVADSSDDATPQIIRQRYGERVRLLRFSRRTDPGTARNAAIAQAQGDLLLFTDADCIVPPDWAARMVQAHREQDCRIVGGSVVNGNPESLISWAGYLKEFSEYLPDARPGFVHSLPTCNISYRREVFQEYGGYQGDYYPQEDYLFHWRLIKGGERIYFDPTIQVHHFHRATLRSYLRHSHRFGVVTSQVLKITDLPGHWFARRPWLAPLFIPFLPFIKFTRTTLRTWRVNPALIRQRPLVLPLLFVGLLSWEIGFIQGVYTRRVGVGREAWGVKRGA